MTGVSVSVVCPAYNRSRAIIDTIESVRAQTFAGWELLVISDGSTDDTDRWVSQAAAADDRVRLHRTGPHGHPSEPRNVGLQLARGEIIAYIDHDDRWRPGHLAAVLSAFDDGAEMVATGFERRDREDRCVGRSEAVALCWHPEIQLVSPLFEPSVTAHRRGLPERVGGWRSGIGLEDWDLWLRLSDAGFGFTTVPERTVILHYDPGTRRHRTPRGFRLLLVSFDDVRAARNALDTLQSGRWLPEILDAAVADLTDWLGRLSMTPLFVWPRGWQADLGDHVAVMAQQDQRDWAQDLVLVQQDGRFVIAQALWCATAAHADRIAAVAPSIQPRQLDVIVRVASMWAGIAMDIRHG